MPVGLDPEIHEEEYEFYATYREKEFPMVIRILAGIVLAICLLPMILVLIGMVLTILLPIAAIYFTAMVIAALAVFLGWLGSLPKKFIKGERS